MLNPACGGFSLLAKDIVKNALSNVNKPNPKPNSKLSRDLIVDNLNQSIEKKLIEFDRVLLDISIDIGILNIHELYPLVMSLVASIYLLVFESIQYDKKIFNITKEGQSVNHIDLMGIVSRVNSNNISHGWVMLSILSMIEYDDESNRLESGYYKDILFRIFTDLSIKPVPEKKLNETIKFLYHLVRFSFTRVEPLFDFVNEYQEGITLLSLYLKFLLVNQDNIAVLKSKGTLNLSDMDFLFDIFFPTNLDLKEYMNYLSGSVYNGFVSLPLNVSFLYHNNSGVCSLIDFHGKLINYFLTFSASYELNKIESISAPGKLDKKVMDVRADRKIDIIANKFNYYYWGFFATLLALASGFKEDSVHSIYAKSIFDNSIDEIDFLLKFIACPDSELFCSNLLEVVCLFADRNVDLDISLFIVPILRKDPKLSGLIKGLFKAVISGANKQQGKSKLIDDCKYTVYIRDRVADLVAPVLHSKVTNISKDDLVRYCSSFVLSLMKIKKYRDKLVFEARRNDYFKSELQDYSHNVDLELIIEGKKIISDDSWLDELDELDDEFNKSKSKSKSKSKNKSKNKKLKPADINQNKEQDSICLFKYQENCDLDVFIKKLPADKNFARLSQLSLKYRIFIKGKVAVFPGMEINDFDLLLIPKGLEKIRRHHLDISLSELEASFQVNDKCSFDSSNLMEMLGERPGKGSGLSSHLCDNYMSVPGYRDYVRYHGFINQWFKLVGKPVDIEVSYHHDSKDILQKLLTLNYLSVCSGLRELHIDYSNNICKVGEVILPKKTEEALKLQKPEDKSKFPFLYIGHQDSIEAERGKYDFEKLLKKNLKRFSEEEHKGIKFKDIIDWSGAGDLIKES